jgi:hypothetical protein
MSRYSHYQQRSSLQVQLRTRSRSSIRRRNRLDVRFVRQISQLVETIRIGAKQHPSCPSGFIISITQHLVKTTGCLKKIVSFFFLACWTTPVDLNNRLHRRPHRRPHRRMSRRSAQWVETEPWLCPNHARDVCLTHDFGIPDGRWKAFSPLARVAP